MSQFDRLNPVTVVGTIAPMSSASASSSVQLPRTSRSRDDAKTQPSQAFPWWRVVFGVLVVAVWIAAAMQAKF